MSKKNKRDIIVITLVIIGIICWLCAFWVHKKREDKTRQETIKYAKQQVDALTHDIDNVIKYKSKYMGDVSNNGNIFSNLPMNDVPRLFSQDANKKEITVYYQGVDWYIGVEKVRRNVVYNSIAAFALVDNLEKITYEFCGSQFKFTRKQVENVLGNDLSGLLNKEIWNKKVRDKMENKKFVDKFYK